jgi:lipopolysaccharide biosynthesis protein
MIEQEKQAMDKRARVIAYYLPQFHPTPENDAWWGKGFTEWTNTAKAKPLFRGHYQPHVPADLGFYDLRCPETRLAQADLAKAHGIEGFCYYHYWFAGRRILERPVNEVIASKQPDFPFCLCWANHSWNSIWQGTPDKILIEQTYPGMDDHAAHFDFLLKAFTDPRYITVDGKPLFVLYKPDDIPNIVAVTDYWRERALQAGLPGLHLVGIAHYNPNWDPRDRGLDACMMQKLPAINGRIPRKFWDIKLQLMLERGDKHKLSIYTYEEMRSFLLRDTAPDFMDYPCVLPNWDNTPRTGLNGLVFHDSTPELFRLHLRDALSKIESHPPENKILFIKAWNEWAEGNHLEPDLRFGKAYLEAVRDETGGGL